MFSWDSYNGILAELILVNLFSKIKKNANLRIIVMRFTTTQRHRVANIENLKYYKVVRNYFLKHVVVSYMIKGENYE